MSQQEISRLECLEKLASRQLTQQQAAALLGVSTRHLRRLQRGYECQGAAFLVSKHRSRPSNNQLSAELKESAIELIKQRYPDFGPTLAHEKLTENHELKLSLESLRGIMMAANIWHGKKRKMAQVHQMRTRRSCLGELIQIDGSPHAWFEDRGPKCCLLVFVDDATSRIMMLHFEEEESAQGYFDATYNYLMQHGVPVAFYSDRHGIFRINVKEVKGGTGETQFSRSLRELDIKLINANSPQAKGRVENKNGTLQDRLVKELRLKNISDISSANDFLPEFSKDYNKRFAKKPASPTDLHRKQPMSPHILRQILSYQFDRIITKNLEVHYENKIYQIQTKTPSYTMRKSKLTVCRDHGKITLIYKEKSLPYKVFSKQNQTTPIATSKQINPMLEEIQPSKTLHKPKKNHPWKRHYVAENKPMAT